MESKARLVNAMVARWFLCLVASFVSMSDRAWADDSDIFSHLDPTFIPADEKPTQPSLTLARDLNELNQPSNGSELSDWLKWIILKNLPPVYEDNRKWGLEKSVYDGFRFRREGLRVETKRAYKTVKHGTWSRYYLEFIDPADRLSIEVPSYRMVSDNRMQLTMACQVPLHAFGRMSQWQRDVQLISLSINADATVRLEVDAEIGVEVSPLVFPPVFQFMPQVQRATVQVVEYKVHRISQLRGPLAKEIGDGLRGMLDERLRDFNERLPSKMNAQLDKQRDKLQLSISQSIPAWFSLPKPQ